METAGGFELLVGVVRGYTSGVAGRKVVVALEDWGKGDN